jgi:hypothetical protein
MGNGISSLPIFHFLRILLFFAIFNPVLVVFWAKMVDFLLFSDVLLGSLGK